MEDKYKQDLENLAALGGIVTTTVSVTSNCDCTFTCDGKNQGKLSPGDVKTVNVRKGEHIFVFTSKVSPKVSVTKVLNCPSMTETYTLVEKDLFKKVQDALNKKKEKSQQLRSNLRKSIKIVGLLAAFGVCALGIFYFVDWMGKEIKEKNRIEKIEAEKREKKEKIEAAARKRQEEIEAAARKRQEKIEAAARKRQEEIEIQNRSLKDAGMSVNDFSFNENASKNGLRGIEITLALECEKKCNTLAKTVITICDKKKTPYPAKNEDFSYEGNCAIVSLDTISSEKHILKKFIPFRSLPKVQRVKGFFFEEYGFWCDISVMDKNEECVYTSNEELLFDKPTDYDKLYASVSVDKVWVDHNVYQDGSKGMLIHVNFDVVNALGENCKCIAYFYKKDGSALKDTNDRFCTVSGGVCASKEFSPGYASSNYGDLSFFMPYSELHVNSKNDLYFNLEFIITYSNGETEWIGSYSKYNFTYG